DLLARRVEHEVAVPLLVTHVAEPAAARLLPRYQPGEAAVDGALQLRMPLGREPGHGRIRGLALRDALRATAGGEQQQDRGAAPGTHGLGVYPASPPTISAPARRRNNARTGC